MNGRLSRERAFRVASYVAHNVRNKITIAQMALVASLSEYHFARAFHATFGLTPMRYVRRIRVGMAIRLIAEGLSLSEAAHECGFASQSHMNQTFNRLGIQTPGQYRPVVTAHLPHIDCGRQGTALYTVQIHTILINSGDSQATKYRMGHKNSFQDSAWKSFQEPRHEGLA